MGVAQGLRESVRGRCKRDKLRQVQLAAASTSARVAAALSGSAIIRTQGGCSALVMVEVGSTQCPGAQSLWPPWASVHNTSSGPLAIWSLFNKVSDAVAGSRQLWLWGS